MLTCKGITGKYDYLLYLAIRHSLSFRHGFLPVFRVFVWFRGPPGVDLRIFEADLAVFEGIWRFPDWRPKDRHRAPESPLWGSGAKGSVEGADCSGPLSAFKRAKRRARQPPTALPF